MSEDTGRAPVEPARMVAAETKEERGEARQRAARQAKSVAAAAEAEARRAALPRFGRSQILEVEDATIQELEIPEWGCVVHLRVMSGMERDRFEASVAASAGPNRLINFRSRFAAMVLCDAEGRRLFTDGDVGVLSRKSGKALDRILDAGLELNGMKEAAEEAALAGFPSGPSGDSGSDSPPDSE